MPEERTLPISPAHREFTVLVAEEPVGREHQLVSVSVVSSANQIAWARLVYLDGAAASGDFPLSNGDSFAPGAEVEIQAGAGNDATTLFKGLVTRHGLRIRDNGAPQLVVECRHAAMKLTVARKNASFFDQKDSDVIEELLGNAGIGAEVEASTVEHEQLVQFHATDWDFLLARAEANGKLILTRAADIRVLAPALGSAVCSLQFGSTLLELDAEIDARIQFTTIRGVSWDSAAQELLEVDANTSGPEGPGNLTTDDLASAAAADALELRHAALSEAEAQAWADSVQQRASLNKVSGRGKCEGIATVLPGDTVTLSGAGDRFNGDVFVSGVRHEFDLVQGWKTHLQFGGVPLYTEQRPTASAPPAGGLLPRVPGLQVGVVVSNEDPEGEHRVRVRLPLVKSDADGIWARVASVDAGDDRGFFFRPELGDEVVIGFFEEDPRRAVLLGMLHSSAKAAPLTGSDDNHEKVYKSRSGMRVHFDDDKKVMTLETPAGNSVCLSEEDKGIVLLDQNGNKIAMNADGITIESSKAVTVKAGTEAGFESGTSFSAKAGSDLKLEGGTQAELSSSATTKVSGGMVQIN